MKLFGTVIFLTLLFLNSSYAFSAINPNRNQEDGHNLENNLNFLIEENFPDQAYISKSDIKNVKNFLISICHPFLLVKLKNQKLSFEENFRNHPIESRADCIKKVIADLHNRYGLPDFSVIISLTDAGSQFSIPTLAFAKKKECNAILIPDFEMLNGYETLDNRIFNANKIHPWGKKIPKAFFRGSTTGGSFNKENWLTFPRIKASLFSLENPDYLDAKVTYLVQGTELIASELYQHGIVGPNKSVEDHLNYKYLLDIDGNSCTYSRCYWILLSNSVLMKHQSNNMQWYYPLLKPFYHYIPIEEDFSDLIEKIEWARANDSLVRKISENATDFAISYLSTQYAHKYFYYILCRYAELIKN